MLKSATWQYYLEPILDKTSANYSSANRTFRDDGERMQRRRGTRLTHKRLSMANVVGSDGRLAYGY